MKEVNLEEILKKSMGKNPNKYVFIAGDNASVEKCLKAMKEACKEVLELAAENAVLHIRSNWGKLNSLPDKSDNYKTKPFFGIEHYGHGDCTYEYITPDKQSIKNTINQVK